MYLKICVCSVCVCVLLCMYIVYEQVQPQAGCARNCKGNAKQGESRGREGERERERGRGGEGETNEREKQQEQCKATRVMFLHEFVGAPRIRSPIYPNVMALVRITEYEKKLRENNNVS